MLIDPQAPASELTIRAEIALRMVQSNTAMLGIRGPHFIDKSILDISIRTADLFIKLLNDQSEPAEGHFDYIRERYLDLQ